MTDVKLTEAQREILSAMAAGRKMVFSQDGECAWLAPRHPTGILNDHDVIGLRSIGAIADEPIDPEIEYGRFGPPTIITPAGRAALDREGRCDLPLHPLRLGSLPRYSGGVRAV